MVLIRQLGKDQKWAPAHLEAPQAASVQITEQKTNAAEIPWITWGPRQSSMGRAEEEKLFLFMFAEELIGVGHAEQRVRICLEFFTCVDADFFFFPEMASKLSESSPENFRTGKESWENQSEFCLLRKTIFVSSGMCCGSLETLP